MKHSLSPTGLSLSQAQSIANLCNQRAREINMTFFGINNAERTVKIGEDTHKETVGKKMPANAETLLLEKGKLHATQAFLMTNIKAKDELLAQLRLKAFTTTLVPPVKPAPVIAKTKPLVSEQPWGWDQLSTEESAEFLEQEAYASHIGQFIHKDSVLDKLRSSLPKINTLEWIDIKVGEKTPLIVTPHHTPEELLKLHESLAALHRKYEMHVNYFKAKVKNMVNDENARICKENAIEQGNVNSENQKINVQFTADHAAWSGAIDKERDTFEQNRQEEIKATASLRILVNERFKETVDKFLAAIDETKSN